VGGHKERRKKSEYGGCILYPYENRTVKPVEVVLRNGEGRKGEQWRVNLSKTYC
jgi:hypothetical protein